MELTHMSLCSGIGGIDLAAEWAGFRTIAQCETDEYASKVLAKNFKGVPNLHDIRTVGNEWLAEYGIDRGAITVLSAGFPCQPYSLAGKGKGDGDERDLWGEVARCIGEIKPRWFVGENTPGLFARANQRYFKRILADLAALGYSVSWGIWGACDVGAPHQRKRVFIVGRNADGTHDETQCEVCKGENPDSGGDSRNFPDAAGERRYSSKIRRGEFKESRNEEDAGRVQESGVQFERICGVIPDANGYGVEQFGEQKEIEKVRRREDNKRRRAKENAIGRWWQTEPDVGRVVTRCPHRVDRLRGLGNMVVPAQIYPLFEVIAEIERGDENA